MEDVKTWQMLIFFAGHEKKFIPQIKHTYCCPPLKTMVSEGCLISGGREDATWVA